MTRRRWIADQASGNRAALVGEHAAHLARVLRAQPGQEFDIAADGAVRRGRILSVSENRVEFELGEAVETAPAPQVTLALAIFKFDRMEWAMPTLPPRQPSVWNAGGELRGKLPNRRGEWRRRKLPIR
jgi:16S rRNA (uracil1498-N3)-methyltransferase